MTTRRGDKKARARRQKEAEARLEQNTVIDCPCGRRHAERWKGCDA